MGVFFLFDFQRMVHLGGPPDPQGYRGQPRRSAADRELLLNGQDAGDESLEASGFNGSDMEERERAEEGGESLEPRGRQQTWAREEEPNGGAGANHTAPDLDALIGQCCGGHQEMLIGLQLLFFSSLLANQATRDLCSPRTRSWTASLTFLL